MNQPTVLIVSDDPEFSGAISCRWQMERSAPTFTLMSGDLCQELPADTFDLAIVGAVHAHLAPRLLGILEQLHKPVIWVSSKHDPAVEVQSGRRGRLIVIPQHEGWLEFLLLAGSEALRRCEALARLNLAEQSNAILERQATLGRYILDMRHNLNNALTSVLGNAELLSLEGESLTEQSQAQIATIRNMALRMHEILQRFSSLEKELNVGAHQSEIELKGRSQAAAAR